jgi:UDP-N-acetylmuramate--alanine ligase
MATDAIKRVHFIGIAGSGMSGLALLADAQGIRISGSDTYRSQYLEAVLAHDIPVSFEQGAQNVADADIDVVVVSTAIPADNPELIAAYENELEIWPRARMLAYLGRDKRTWAVAGTHGKTTTSSMLASTLDRLGADPSFLIGGVLKGYESSAQSGQGRDYVIEADESDESFTWLSPKLAIITNIERDHLDHYHSLEEIYAAFGRFIATLTEDDTLVYCADDRGLARLVQGSVARKVSYGQDQAADFSCRVGEQGAFVLRCPDGQELECKLPVSPGAHNMLNATAVVAACTSEGYVSADVTSALEQFAGVKRRFEVIGRVQGIDVVDDYGHHPTEIKATLAAAQSAGYHHVHLLFQPHRFTRTQHLLPEFSEAFTEADSLFVLDIYSAGEQPLAGIDAETLINAVRRRHPEADITYAPDRAAALLSLAKRAKPGDVILTMGAGDVTTLAPQLVAVLEQGQNDRVKKHWTAPIFEAYCELEGSVQGRLNLDEPMSRHTSFRIGGPAALFIECANLTDLNRSLEVIQHFALPWTVVGRGSNLLVSDEGFEGAVLNLGHEFKSFRFPDDSPEGTLAKADAGDGGARKGVQISGEQDNSLRTGELGLLSSGAAVPLGNLVQKAFKKGFSGLEFAVGIPGTLGGAVFMNAGTAHEWISAIVANVTVLRPGVGLVRYRTDDLDWAYRKSNIPLGEIILEAELLLKKGNTAHIRALMEGALRRRQKTQPLNMPNAGSIFRNPEGESAGQLIDSLGLKGFRVGDASVSSLHANFIVNEGSARARDVLTLIQEIKRRVKVNYGRELQTEIRFIGFS